MLRMHIILTVNNEGAGAAQVVHWTLARLRTRRLFPANLHIIQTHLSATRSPSRWVPGALLLGVQRQWLETDNSPPNNVKVKNA